MKEKIVEYNDVDDGEAQYKLYKTAFRIFNELKVSNEELKKAIDYYIYIENCNTTLDNIIIRNELTLREFETLRLLLELKEFLEKKSYEIVSITTLIMSARRELWENY